MNDIHSNMIFVIDSFRSRQSIFAAPLKCFSVIATTLFMLVSFWSINTAHAQSSLFAEPVISAKPKFSRQVSTQINGGQESATEMIVGEEIPDTMKAELIDDSNLFFGPLDQNGQVLQPESLNNGLGSSGLGSSGLPSLGSEATLRGPSSSPSIQNGSSALSNQYPDSSSIEGTFSPLGSTRQMKETSERLRGMEANVPESSTRSIERLPEMTDESHEVVRQNYPSGKTRIQRTVAQDETGNYYNDGRWIMFNEQGQPITIGTYVRGKMQGVWLRSHPIGSGGIFSERPFSMFQGPYKSEAYFNRNKLDGTWALSDREGNPMCEIPYIDGVRHGVAKWYYPTGSVMRQVRFNEGSPDGLLQQWDEQNKLLVREEFANGRKIVRQRAFYPNKVKSKEDVYQDKKLVVDGEDDWWSAQPAPFATEGERVQHGSTAAWYPNNQRKMLGRYQDGLRQGTFTWWHANGNKELEGSFEKGEKVGTWTWWYESGMKKIQGTYVDDEPDGLWMWWNQDGEVIDRKSFPLPVEEIDKPEDNVGDTSESSTDESALDESAIDGFDMEGFMDFDPFNEDEDGEQDQERKESTTEGSGGLGMSIMTETEVNAGDRQSEPIDSSTDTEDEGSMEPIFGEPEIDSDGELPARIFEDGQ